MTRQAVLPSHPDAYHLTCCRTDDPGDVALCGSDVSGDEWTDDTPYACAPCALLEQTDYCPLRLTCQPVPHDT